MAFSAVLSEVYRRALATAEILRRTGCEVLVACSGDLLDIPSGYIAARRAGCAFFVYLFDDYVYQWTNSAQRWFAGRIARGIMKRTEGVIAPNELLAEEWRRRYGAKPTIVRNPCESVV